MPDVCIKGLKEICDEHGILLILDEVFDSSLDASGTDEFLKILNHLTGKQNVFIISHKGDVLFDKFKDVIRFEKFKNFSRVVV